MFEAAAIAEKERVGDGSTSVEFGATDGNKRPTGERSRGGRDGRDARHRIIVELERCRRILLAVKAEGGHCGRLGDEQTTRDRQPVDPMPLGAGRVGSRPAEYSNVFS